MFNLTNPSLTLRIAWGKLIGLAIGIFGFVVLPYFMPQTDMMFRIGVLFWYSTIGAVIGLGGIYTWHPILNLKMAWWWRGMIYGVWFNFLLLLFTYETLSQLMINYFGTSSIWASPWWILLEGAIVGFFIDLIVTSIAGEGPGTIESPDD